MNLAPYTVPFTILIDTAEGQPFRFHGLTADANKNERPLVVPTRFSCLGRHPHSLGDYSIEGFSDRVAVERKSIEDCWSTVMGWETSYQREHDQTGRRERFEKELSNLAQLDCAMVVVEAELSECLARIPEWGTKPVDTNRKIFNRSIIAFLQDYKVPWLFCPTRWMAERETFLFFNRFYRKHKKEF